MKRRYIFLLLFIGIFSIYTLGRIALCNYIDSTLLTQTPKSSIPIDIVLIATTKDFDVVPYSIQSIRKYLQQPIHKAVLIAPKNDESIKLAQELQLELIDENSLLNLQSFKNWIKDNNLSYNYHSITWYYQQFLKLLYSNISESDYYFVIDADIIMNRPFNLVTDNKIHTFFIGDNHAHEISKTSIQKLLGKEQYVPEFSYISDLMCFEKSLTQKLIEKIELRSGMKLYKAAILVEQNSNARFSEYELYGSFANYNSDEKNRAVNYIPSVYASDQYFKNYLNSWHYLSSGHTRKRNSLFWDRYDPTLKAYPYIAYHSWVKDYTSGTER